MAGGVEINVVCDPSEFSTIFRSPDLSILKAVRYVGTAAALGMHVTCIGVHSKINTFVTE